MKHILKSPNYTYHSQFVSISRTYCTGSHQRLSLIHIYTRTDGFGGNNRMNSFNHYSFGAVGAWMYNYSLGIQRDETSPGFKQFVLKPMPDPTGKMTYARGYYDSMYGRIESGWKVESGVIRYTFTVPANTTATLYLPAASLRDVREKTKPVRKRCV